MKLRYDLNFNNKLKYKKNFKFPIKKRILKDNLKAILTYFFN